MGGPDIEKMEQKRDIKGLIRTLKHEEAPSVRFEIREALARIGEPAVGPLIQALKDAYVHVHVRWLARRSHPASRIFSRVTNSSSNRL